MSIMTLFVGAVFVFVIGFFCFMIYRTGKAMIKSMNEPSEDEYTVRKKQYLANIDERQHQFLKDIKGASLTEIIALLEGRIHDLESKLRESERRNLDDGK